MVVRLVGRGALRLLPCTGPSASAGERGWGGDEESEHETAMPVSLTAVYAVTQTGWHIVGALLMSMGREGERRKEGGGRETGGVRLGCAAPSADQSFPS